MILRCLDFFLLRRQRTVAAPRSPVAGELVGWSEPPHRGSHTDRLETAHPEHRFRFLRFLTGVGMAVVVHRGETLRQLRSIFRFLGLGEPRGQLRGTVRPAQGVGLGFIVLVVDLGHRGVALLLVGLLELERAHHGYSGHVEVRVQCDGMRSLGLLAAVVVVDGGKWFSIAYGCCMGDESLVVDCFGSNVVVAGSNFDDHVAGGLVPVAVDGVGTVHLNADSSCVFHLGVIEVVPNFDRVVAGHVVVGGIHDQLGIDNVIAEFVVGVFFDVHRYLGPFRPGAHADCGRTAVLVDLLDWFRWFHLWVRCWWQRIGEGRDGGGGVGFGCYSTW